MWGGLQRCRQPVLRVHPPRSRRPGDPVEFLALACGRKGACHGAQLDWIVQWTAITVVDSHSWIPGKLCLVIEGSIHVAHLIGDARFGVQAWCDTVMLAKSGHVSDDVSGCMFFSEGAALCVFLTCIRRLEVA